MAIRVIVVGPIVPLVIVSAGRTTYHTGCAVQLPDGEIRTCFFRSWACYRPIGSIVSIGAGIQVEEVSGTAAYVEAAENLLPVESAVSS